MQPKYFLLRDNQESGPYTIDELLLQRLTSTDLVWVPGRTNAWCHPSELEEFTVTYSVNREKLREIDPGPEKQNTPRRPKRSGRGEIESRAEEIRQNILNQAILSGSRRLEIQEDESPTSFKIPEERINLVVHKKRIKPPNPHFLAICFMLVIIAGAWFGRDIWVNRSRFLDSVAKPVNENATVVIPEKKQTITNQNIVTNPVKTDTTSSQLLAGQDSLGVVSAEMNPVNKPVIKKQTTQRIYDSNAIKKEPTIAASESVQLNNKETGSRGDSDAVKSEEKNDLPEIVVADKSAKENTDAKKEDSVAATKTEKKKGFFGRLFKKKKDG